MLRVDKEVTDVVMACTQAVFQTLVGNPDTHARNYFYSIAATAPQAASAG